MSFFNKLGRGLAAGLEGVAEVLPGALEQRARREERSTALSLQASQRDEARIYMQFETDPEGAIQAATATGNDKLVAALTGMRAGKERTGLQKKAGELGTLTDVAEQYKPRYGTAADRAASVGDVREQREKLIAEGGAFTTYAEGTSVGMGDPGRAALTDNEAAIEYLTKIEDQLTRPDQILRGIDAHMDPDMMAKRFFRLDASMQDLGLDPTLSSQHIATLKKGFQRQRDEEFKVLLEPYVMAHRYDDARRIMIEMRVSPTMENYTEALIRAEKERVGEGVTEAKRFDVMQGNLARVDLLRQFKELALLVNKPEVYKSEALLLIDSANNAGFHSLANTISRQYAERLRSIQAEGPDGLRRRVIEDYAANPFQFSAAITAFLGEPLDRTTEKSGQEFSSLEQLNRYIELLVKSMYPEYDPKAYDANEEINAIADSVIRNTDMGLDPESILRNLPEETRAAVQSRIAEIMAARLRNQPRPPQMNEPGGLFGDYVPPGGPQLQPRPQGPPVMGPTLPLSSSPDALGTSVRGTDPRIGDALPFLP